MIRRPPRSTLFPYRRSSDLSHWARSWAAICDMLAGGAIGMYIAETPASSGTRLIISAVTSVAAYLAVAWLLLGAVELRSEEHTSELQSRLHLVCRLQLEKKNHRPVRTRTTRFLFQPDGAPVVVDFDHAVSFGVSDLICDDLRVRLPLHRAP